MSIKAVYFQCFKIKSLLSSSISFDFKCKNNPFKTLNAIFQYNRFLYIYFVLNSKTIYDW